MHKGPVAILMLAAFIMTMAATPVFADQPGANWITKEQAMEKLKAGGYAYVTGLKADDGRWEGKGVKNGKIMKFHMDPHSGAFTKEKIDD